MNVAEKLSHTQILTLVQSSHVKICSGVLSTIKQIYVHAHCAHVATYDRQMSVLSCLAAYMNEVVVVSREEGWV